MHTILFIFALAAAGEDDGRERTAAQLASRLDSEDRVVRDTAAEELRRLEADPKDIWKAVKPKLRSDRPDTRRTVVRLAHQMRIEHAVSSVSTTLRHDEDPTVRREASHALARLDPEGAVSELRTVALRDREVMVRRAAILDLGLIGSTAAARVLYELLEDSLAQRDEYISGIVQQALTLATGQSLGENLEGWRHWLASQTDDDPLIIEVHESSARDEG